MRIRVCMECYLVFDEDEEIPNDECPGCQNTPEVFFADRTLDNIEAEKAKTELMSQVTVEVVKAIQRHIESGPPHEELTHATVLCTELISNLEKAEASERNFWAQFNRLSEQSEKTNEAVNMLTNLLDILKRLRLKNVWQPNEAGRACLAEARRIVKDREAK